MPYPLAGIVLPTSHPRTCTRHYVLAGVAYKRCEISTPSWIGNYPNG